MTSGQELPSRWISIGAGGHTDSVADALDGVVELIAVSGQANREWDVPVLTSDDEAIERARTDDALLLVTIGDNDRRLTLTRDLRPELLLTAAARTAMVSRSATLGHGTVVLHGAHVGPRSKVGDGVIINTGAIVEHDCVVGDGAHIAPGACLLGAATVGEGSLIGSGARVLPGIRVGDRSVVGAGAVVTADVPNDSVVRGIPAH